ncbi:uncharacterized protein LOC131569131 [Ammospiza caudacuta]|uniref:uncharacterized protein LOC131569131 n=1 Tax=Ammospiza caudacuta TaxID=2857398 RepID=UPI00273A2E69|nr:uncharacterized protein LOC131569131 [Ammospiza caudacuta]
MSGGGGGTGTPPGTGTGTGTPPRDRAGRAARAGPRARGLEQRQIRLDAAAAAPLQPAGPPVPAGEGLRAGQRGGPGPVPAGFPLPPVADVPERVPGAARFPPHHRLRLGLHPAQRADAAGPGAAAAPAGPR